MPGASQGLGQSIVWQVMNGVLLVDKPEGPSSAAIVARLKKQLNLSKAGHGGTLDPLATGLLLILCGSATRFSEFFLQTPKNYVGRIRLGRETTTDDREGDVVSEDQTIERVRTWDWAQRTQQLQQQFSGCFKQVPPQYSALKVGGKRSYDSARHGEIVKHQAREVEVKALSLCFVERPDGFFLEYELSCSSGFYVRALARDIGRELGTGAYAESIRRTRSGNFSVEQAVTPEAVTTGDLQSASSHFITVAEIAQSFPRIALSALEWALLSQGQQQVLQQKEALVASSLVKPVLGQTERSTPTVAALFDENNIFRGLVEKLECTEALAWQIRFLCP